MKYIRFLLAIVGLSLATQAGIANELTNNIRNFKLLSGNIFTSGSINKGGYQALANNQFEIIINVRMPEEGSDFEQKQVIAQGMSYYNLPIDGRSVPAAHIDILAKILSQNQDKKILIHCVSANRAGALWAEYQIKQGVSLDSALNQGRAIGMGGYLEEWIKNRHN